MTGSPRTLQPVQTKRRRSVRPRPSVGIDGFRFAPANLGSGWWLIGCRANGIVDAWVPPGVAVDRRAHDAIDRWRWAQWSTGSCETGAETTVEIRTARAILDEVPADYAAWVIRCTEEQLDLLSCIRAAAGTALRRRLDRRLRRLRAELGELQRF